MTMYDLIPTNSQRSYYGKARVAVDAGQETLYSYNTAIIRRDASGALVRLWDGWTATTGKHIRSFCGLSKAEFLALPFAG